MKFKIFHKIIVSFLSLILLFTGAISYVIYNTKTTFEEVERNTELVHGIYELTIVLHQLSNVTKDYTLNREKGTAEGLRSMWVNYFYKMNSALEYLKDNGSYPEAVGLIEENILIVNNNVDMVVDINALLSVTSDEGKKEELIKERENALGELNVLQKKISGIVENVNAEAEEEYHLSMRRNQDIITAAYYIFMFVIILSFILAVLISYSISIPIHKLYKGTEAIEKGNLDFKVGTDAGDEIGQLSRSFDKMVSAFKKSLQKIESQNRTLDEEVKIRTKELDEKNKELERTLEDFYTIRLGMQRDLEKGTVSEENKKIRERLDKLKR
ncbi:hypothetical protein A2303_04055 [Candidatus Falkowbacteria bacterium RIFOXYB2_FULL_47_14]|uniref:histidine kinase n=1 Tax=Candidatus Falkowbacteria bacterium RIFOXYA2_FULL_47_19 TaxID=1797994 RepID=A0A1F5SI42_9BACT|nr:MAG: hypothetical protein A2227_03600 [Candidatus Falkowbacteria bacterium RIFOXYA2_FULL_47_19]OGF35442.1 MAG: hypothetical protein A2468_03165 [Candidatus Falkowbacteria bacterium RIFOXYC2_FULL_46_15]OGF42566.1 MAG: hypothetical protein A2303_04055 [Candidatus Falkowbacteria bacterium RIFOXYB2_FULL_47_14]